jgi:hypothetical protein
MLTTYDLVARAIKSRVDTFSDRRLHDGDDVWRERELELRSAVAATANAIAVELLEHAVGMDRKRFALACGLYVSDGRDSYSDCHPGELTWERPRDYEESSAAPALPSIGKACVWGRCNGTQGPDGRCNRCGSKRP